MSGRCSHERPRPPVNAEAHSGRRRSSDHRRRCHCRSAAKRVPLAASGSSGRSTGCGLSGLLRGAGDRRQLRTVPGRDDSERHDYRHGAHAATQPADLRDGCRRVAVSGGAAGSRRRGVDAQEAECRVKFATRNRTSPKGGCGATTITVNLAIALASEKAGRALIVDLDPELGDAALLLGVEPRFGVVDLVNSLGRFDASLLDSLVAKHESGVHLLSAPEDPQEVGLLSGREISAVFEAVRDHYDWLLVDTPKSLVTSTMVALEVADDVLFVTLLDLLSLKKATRSQALLNRLLKPGFETRLKLLVNRHSPDDVITLEDVRDALGLDVYQSLRNDYASVIQSINAGDPVRESSPFARDVRQLAKKLIKAQEQDGVKAKAAKKGSFLWRAISELVPHSS
ncbi:MAG: AAA family ATPase [Gemmatimonadales bacterium]